jgi:hypothetical protein
MKMKAGDRLRKILVSPWLLALIPAIVIGYYLPHMSSLYRLQVEDTGKAGSTSVYYDLDSDSITEVMRSGKGVPYYNILVSNNNSRIFDQWNLKDDFNPGFSDIFFGNIDNDHYKEILVFTHRNDSLFLNVNEFFEPAGIRLERLFITKIGYVNGTVTSSVYPAGFFDVNNDGYKELYFSIVTGFGLEPRLLYYYDFINKELRSSERTGTMFHKPYFIDIDGDNKPEIFGQMNASGNYKTPVPFTDRSTWLMVFNEKLTFEFPPVEIPGMTNSLDVHPYFDGKFYKFLLSHTTGSADTSVLKPRILLYYPDGKKFKERAYTDFGFNGLPFIQVIKNKAGDRIYILEKRLIEVSKDLDIINFVDSPFHSPYYSYTSDIDLDGEDEIILYSDNEEKMVIYNAALKILAEANLKAIGWQLNFSHSISEDRKQRLFMTSGENSYFLDLEKNDLYYIGYIAYPGIYLLIVLSISGINRINTRQVEQKERLKQRLLTLQLQGIKSQLDPHFTFNTLNSIAALIYLEERQSAYDYLNKFTLLLRTMLNDAERIYRSLGEELEFVTTYLELEKMRFGEKFNYTIEIGEGISQREEVPKLVLQTFAENAVKHGITPCSDGGILRIMAIKETDYLKLTIEDNGIGREKSSGQSMSTGKGLKITREFYEILNQINKQPIIHTITDLHNENGVSIGTRVDVWVPLKV